MKKINRRINVLTVTLFLQDSLQGFSSLQVALAILVTSNNCYVNYIVFDKLKGKNEKKKDSKIQQYRDES